VREASLWDHLRSILPSDIHYSRIESDTSPGFPDVHYTLSRQSGTIELKSTKAPKATFPFGGENGLRQSQKDWIKAERQAGGVVFLCLQVGRMVYFLDGGEWQDLHCLTLDQINDRALLAWNRSMPDPLRLRQILENP